MTTYNIPATLTDDNGLFVFKFTVGDKEFAFSTTAQALHELLYEKGSKVGSIDFQ